MPAWVTPEKSVKQVGKLVEYLRNINLTLANSYHWALGALNAYWLFYRAICKLAWAVSWKGEKYVCK